MDKKTLKPRIRFANFTDAWEQRKLGSAIDIGSGQDYKHLQQGPIPVYGTGGYMLSVNKALSQKDAVGIGRKGTIDNPFILNAPFWTVDTLFYCVPQVLNLSFLYAIFQTINWKALDESTGVPSLSKTTINDIDFAHPKREEQDKIGTLFKHLDDLITLHQRKLEKLSNVKKSLLEKMFPQKNSSTPKVRFKGFTDAWEQRKFKRTILIERGGSPRPIEDFITNSEKGLNWVKIGDAPEMGKYITHTAEKIKPEGLSKTREVHPGDLILSNSMSFGRPYIMAIDGCIHDGWLLLRNEKSIYNLQFLCHLLGTENMLNQYKSFASGSTVNNLNKELVGNTVVSFPQKAEQEKIGTIFNQLDNLITLHQRKLEKLKNVKKALLEKMFV